MVSKIKLLKKILRKSKEELNTKKREKVNNNTIYYLMTKYTSLQLHYFPGRGWLIGKARGWKVM